MHQDNMNAKLLKKRLCIQWEQNKAYTSVVFTDQIPYNIRRDVCEIILTEEIPLDQLTKLLQGVLFSKFREDIQGILLDIPNKDPGWDITKVSSSSILQECVGTGGKILSIINIPNGNKHP